jgi:uncharacterized protein (DUF302 family)
MKKQTAVEKAIDLINKDFEENGRLRFAYVQKVLNEAKEMERQQIIDACGSKYSEEEFLEQLNHLMTMPSSVLDKFTDDNGSITMKWFEQFKRNKMKKETAVEWLVKELFPDNEIFGISNALIYQAKKMEKQQIIDACGSMYSEKEVIEIVEKSRATGLTAEFLILTEQFKKK